MGIRHRYWYKIANGPLPNPLPKIIKKPCPYYVPNPHGISCCNYPEAMFFNKWDYKNRWVLYHDTGHWFDSQYFNDLDREEIRLHFNWPDMEWWYKTDPSTNPRNPNCERFADAYAQMLLHPREYKWLRAKCRNAKFRSNVGTPKMIPAQRNN